MKSKYELEHTFNHMFPPPVTVVKHALSQAVKSGQNANQKVAIASPSRTGSVALCNWLWLGLYAGWLIVGHELSRYVATRQTCPTYVNELIFFAVRNSVEGEYGKTRDGTQSILKLRRKKRREGETT